MVKKLIKYITEEEYGKLVKAEKDKRYKLAYMLMFRSGLRISEVLGYKGISVKHKKDKDKKIIETIKNPIEIKPLSPEQINLSSHQIRVFGKGSKERITVTPKNLKESHLKLLPLKINRRTFQYHLMRLSEKVLNKKISPHQLRHGFGNYMANEKNNPLPFVQSLLGHSRLDTTGIYTKANPVQAIDKAWESF